MRFNKKQELDAVDAQITEFLIFISGSDIHKKMQVEV